MFVGKKKIHSAVQNDTVLGFFILYMNSEWNGVVFYKTRRFISI
jgi:hypothetical protein